MTEGLGAKAVRSFAAALPRHLGWFFPLMAVAVSFAPFLFMGQHALPFHRVWGSQTGMEGGGDPPACVPPPRGRDASDLLIHYPNETLVAKALRAGELPTWNPFVGAGAPGLGGGQVYPLSPFFWPFYAVPNPWTFTAGLLMACLWGGAGVFLWLGRFGLPDWARGFGGAAWVLSPWVTQFFTVSDVWAGAWFGWLLWAWDRALHDPRFWWLPASMVAGMTYCGHPGAALLLAGTSAGYALASWTTLEAKDRPRFSTFCLSAAGTVALSGAMTAVHWLPVAMRSTEALPYKFIAPEAILHAPVSIWDFFVPTAATYLAPCVLAVACLGFFRKGRHRAIWLPVLLLTIAGVGLLQPPGLRFLNGLLTAGGLVPGFYYRSVLCFGLIPLLAAGAVSLLAPSAWKRPWTLAMLIAPVLLYTLYFSAVMRGAPGMTWVLCQCAVLVPLTAAVLLPNGPGRNALAVVSLTLLCLDPFVLLPGWVSNDSPYRLKGDPAARFSVFSSRNPGHQDPSSWATPRTLLSISHGRMWAGTENPKASIPFLAPNLSTLWGVRDIRVQDVLLGFRMALLHQEIQGSERPWYFTSLNFAGTSMQDLALLGVAMVASPVDRNSGRFTWAPVADALPRAYLVHRAEGAESVDESIRLLRKWLKDRDRFRQGAIVEGWTGPADVGTSDGKDAVRWLEDGLTRVGLEADSSSGGVLVLLDAFAEGWEARLDGRPAQIYPANLAFRAVAVPPGTHKILFSYHAPGAARGLLISGMGWVALLYLAFAGHRRRRQDSHVVAGGGA